MIKSIISIALEVLKKTSEESVDEFLAKVKAKTGHDLGPESEEYKDVLNFLEEKELEEKKKND